MAGNITNMINLGIGVGVTGATQAKKELDNVTESSEKLANQTSTNTTQQDKFTTALGSFRQNLPNVASAVYLVQQAYQALNTALEVTNQAYEDQYSAEVKLQTILNSTGNAIGYNYDQVYQLAQSWQSLTGINDAIILQTAGIAATFTQISEEIFPDAIEQALNMSTIFGQDVQQSMIQLGTALNDPIRGLGRLRRIGISFTDEQKEMTKALAEAGDILGAEIIIIDELEREIGQVAKAMGETSLGAIKKYETALENLFEEVGEGATNFKAELLDALNITEQINNITNALSSVNLSTRLEDAVNTGLLDTDIGLTNTRMDELVSVLDIYQNKLNAFRDIQEKDAGKLFKSLPASEVQEEIDRYYNLSVAIINAIAKKEELNAALSEPIDTPDTGLSDEALAYLEALKKTYAFKNSLLEMDEIGQSYAKERNTLITTYNEIMEKGVELGISKNALEEALGGYTTKRLVQLTEEENTERALLKIKERELEVAEKMEQMEEARTARMDFFSEYGTEREKAFVEMQEELDQIQEYYEAGGISAERFLQISRQIRGEFENSLRPEVDPFAEFLTSIPLFNLSMEEAIEDAQFFKETMDDLGTTLQGLYIDGVSDAFYELGYAMTNTSDAVDWEEWALEQTEALMSTVGPALISAGAQQLAATAGSSPVGWALLAAGAAMTVGAGAISGLIDATDSSSSSSSAITTTDTETAYTFDTSSTATADDESSKSTIIVNNNTSSSITTDETFSETGEKVTQIIIDSATKSTATQYGLTKNTKSVV